MINANFQVKRRPIEVTHGAMNLVEVTINKESREYWNKIVQDIHDGKYVTFDTQILQKSLEYIPVFLYVFWGDWECRHIVTLEYTLKDILPGFSEDNPNTCYYLEYVGEKTKTAFVNACKALGFGGFVVYIPMHGWVMTDPVNLGCQILDESCPFFRDGSCFD